MWVTLWEQRRAITHLERSEGPAAKLPVISGWGRKGLVEWLGLADLRFSLCVSAGLLNNFLVSLQRLSNQRPQCWSQLGMLQGNTNPATEQRGFTRGPGSTASWHVNAAPSAGALQQTLCNGLFWICISFASHMGSVFPFSLFFLIAFFLVIIISVSLPCTPPSFFTAVFDWFQSCRCSFGPRRRGKGSLPFQCEAASLAGGVGEASVLPNWPTLLLPPPASCASGEVCQIARYFLCWRPGEHHKLLMVCMPLLLHCAKPTVPVSGRGRSPVACARTVCIQGARMHLWSVRAHWDWLKLLFLCAVRLTATAAPHVWLCQVCGPLYKA